MRIPLIYKRIWNYFGAFFFAAIVFIVGYSMITKSNLGLEDTDSFTGTITNAGITKNKGSVAGKGSMSRDVFFFRIKGLNQTLALYNISQDYTELDRKINEGDNVTVYFLRSPDSLKPNLHVYQLEKEGEMVQSIDKYTNTESNIGYIVFIMGFVFIGLGIYQDKKLLAKK